MVNRAFVSWLVMLLVAVVNGAFREAVLRPRYGALPAHQISTVMLCVELLVLTWFTIAWIRPPSAKIAGNIGWAWLVLTLVFEFGAGLAARKSWAVMLGDYNFTNGHIWPLALLVTGLAPYVMYRVRHIRTTAPSPPARNSRGR